MSQLILVRHGQSQWNLENRFTGWVDVPLTDKGVREAEAAGQLLLDNHLDFDCAYTSYLQRAIETLWWILKTTDRRWMGVEKSWRLNERHYGGLQGLNKKETAEKFGDEQVFQWRRSYATLPPEASGPLYDSQRSDPRYKELTAETFPKSESLQVTVERVVPYWDSEIAPQIQKGKNVLVVAHGNSLRALVKNLADIGDDEISKFEFATGVPLVCELDTSLKLQSMKFLGAP